MKASMIMIQSPLMLVGAERSGTTLLRLMLDHHPQIAFLPEFEFAIDLVREAGEWPPLEEFYKWLLTNRDFLEYDLRIHRGLDYPSLIDSFLRQKRDREEKPIVGATVHRDFDRLRYIWPDVRFIHLIRDGRDVADSVIRMGWAGNTWAGVQRWLEAEELWDSMRDQIPERRRIDVSYERLVSEPIGTLTTICEFAGVKFHPSMLDYPGSSTYSGPDENLASQWKRKQSDWEVRLAESRIADMLLSRGYELSGLPLLAVTLRMQRALKRQDRWTRRRMRMRMYGLRLFSEDVLSRCINLESWKNSVKRRLNAVDRRYLK